MLSIPWRGSGQPDRVTSGTLLTSAFCRLRSRHFGSMRDLWLNVCRVLRGHSRHRLGQYCAIAGPLGHEWAQPSSIGSPFCNHAIQELVVSACSRCTQCYGGRFPLLGPYGGTAVIDWISVSFGPCVGAAVIDWVSVSFDPLVGPCAGTAVILWVCYSWQWL